MNNAAIVEGLKGLLAAAKTHLDNATTSGDAKLIGIYQKMVKSLEAEVVAFGGSL